MTSPIRIHAFDVLLVNGTLTTVAQVPPALGTGAEGYASVLTTARAALRCEPRRVAAKWNEATEGRI